MLAIAREVYSGARSDSSPPDEELCRNESVVFPRLVGWASTIVNGSTRHGRGQLDTFFSEPDSFKTGFGSPRGSRRQGAMFPRTGSSRVMAHMHGRTLSTSR